MEKIIQKTTLVAKPPLNEHMYVRAIFDPCVVALMCVYGVYVGSLNQQRM